MSLQKELNYRFRAFQIEGEDGYQWGIEFPDVNNIGGGGDTVIEAYEEALENLRVYLDYLKENNMPIPLPTKEPRDSDFSGKLVLRLSKTNHMRISELAKEEGLSINSLLNEIITEGIENRICKKAVFELVDDIKKDYELDTNLSLNLNHN